MLNYNVQYNLANGIFLTFKNNLSKRSFTVNHKPEKVEKMKCIFPYFKYETYTKENFISACLLIMFNYNPSSINKMLDYLREEEYENIIKFKNEILMYSEYIQKDITLLRERYGNPSINSVVKEFKDKNIKFYTVYFYLKLKGASIDELIDNSRVTGSILQKIKQMMLFVTFKEEAINKITVLFEETSILKGDW